MDRFETAVHLRVLSCQSIKPFWWLFSLAVLRYDILGKLFVSDVRALSGKSSLNNVRTFPKELSLFHRELSGIPGETCSCLLGIQCSWNRERPSYSIFNKDINPRQRDSSGLLFGTSQLHLCAGTSTDTLRRSRRLSHLHLFAQVISTFVENF